ncbi:type I restriction endonuclease subunit R [Levilactobacillus namurensis]|uniref:type I restriction endonuclease subunit R n=1 Tax=Levilactobacillus namurensis TaxID=380393 RepID=UPI0026F15326|nr:type I restriction endonuclease subunit R [Levilactobacillus namurensis]
MANDYQSEAQLEDQFMKRLNALGYQTVKLPDEAAVLAHFREVLIQRNAKNLTNPQTHALEPLTDKEFHRVLNELVGSRTIYEIGQLLRGSDVQPQGKISIVRDDNSEVYLNIFDGRDAENNQYEVAHQITIPSRYENRYDVTILINGLPLVQIELKRRGVEFTQAFNQIIRYRDESFRQLFRFVQLFVVSNGDDTRYFANGDGPLNANFMFYWTDQQNHWLNDIDAFTASFFDRQRLHSLIAEYTIFDNVHNQMLIMRPYQVYAAESIIDQAQNHPHDNGYIWHTTGSGKTITAFKASQLIAHRTDATKVIFLIDRSDLDIQTAKNFNAYLPKSMGNEPALDRTDNTDSLVHQLKSQDNQLIVTTIQKMNNAIKNPRYRSVLTPYHDQHVVFIEDEAHRSQFGEMRKGINQWFQNAQHFGFTGTPIFPENVGADGRTTETLYGQCLHKYLIQDAIRDHNVLGFSIQYLNTLRGKDEIEDGDERVAKIDTREVLEADERLKGVVNHILWNHDQVTHNRQYNALFTVANTEIALKYYRMFHELDPHHQLKVATIFTWTANEEDAEDKQKENATHTKVSAQTSRHGLEGAIADYNQQYGTSFDTDRFKDYFADVSKRMKEHNSQTPEDNIDILIVVNMFLTGFDSPKLSTLYVDKKLQWHSLIQAFSRTNRVEKKTKVFGNIVCYRNIKAETDAAVELFSQGSSQAFFVPTYQELAKQYDDAIKALHEVAPTPQDVDELYSLGTDEVKKFVLAFREVLRINNKIRVYDEYDPKEVPGMTVQNMESYRSKYAEAYRKLSQDQTEGPEGSILDDVDFEIELLATDVINVQYIFNLIKSINLDSQDNTNADRKKIQHLLENADNEELALKADLLADFLDKVVPTLSADANVGSELNKYLVDRQKKEVADFSKEVHLPGEFMDNQLEHFDFYGKADDRKLNQALTDAGVKFMEKLTLKTKITNFFKRELKRFARV